MKISIQKHLPTVSAQGDKLKGEPLPIVFTNDDHTFELNEDLLKQVLLNPKVADKKVGVKEMKSLNLWLKAEI